MNGLYVIQWDELESFVIGELNVEFWLSLNPDYLNQTENPFFEVPNPDLLSGGDYGFPYTADRFVYPLEILPPFGSMLSAITNRFLHIFGYEGNGYHVFTICCHFILTVISFFWVKKHHGELAALFAALFILVNPILFSNASNNVKDYPLVLFEFLLLMSFTRLVTNKDLISSLLFGLSVAAAFATKQNSVQLILPLIILFVFVCLLPYAPKVHHLLKMHPSLISLIAALAISVSVMTVMVGREVFCHPDVGSSILFARIVSLKSEIKPTDILLFFGACFLCLRCACYFFEDARPVGLWYSTSILVTIFVTIVTFTLVFWPQLALQGGWGPLTSSFKYALNVGRGYPVWFEGEFYQAGIDLPKIYAHMQLLFKTPSLTLLGLLALLLVMSRKKSSVLENVCIIAACLILGKYLLPNTVIYDGTRHIIDVLPPLCVLSGIGFSHIVNRVSNKSLVRACIFCGVVATMTYNLIVNIPFTSNFTNIAHPVLNADVLTYKGESISSLNSYHLMSQSAVEEGVKRVVITTGAHTFNTIANQRYGLQPVDYNNSPSWLFVPFTSTMLLLPMPAYMIENTPVPKMIEHNGQLVGTIFSLEKDLKVEPAEATQIGQTLVDQARGENMCKKRF